LVCQMVSAIVYDFPFIAETDHSVFFTLHYEM